MMATYSTAALRDICESVEYGFTASAIREPVGPRFLRITDIVPEQLDWERVPFCEIESKKLAKYRLRTGDIVIARTGATTGWAKFIKNPPDAIFASYLIRIRPAPTVDARFLGFVVESPVYKDFIQQHMGGAAQPNANAQVLTSYEIPLPPLPTQKRIAGILSAYDELIENSQRRIKILETMARNLYREWFIHFRYPGHEKAKLVTSSLGQIPEGWEVKAIADVCESVSYGYTASASRKEVGPKFLRITDIVPDVINWPGVPFCEIPKDKAPKYLLKHGDIVVARTGATTGYAKRLNKLHPDTVFASYLVRARAKDDISNRMLGVIMESDEYKQFIQTNIGGAAQPQANAVVLTSMRIAVPSASVGKKFDQIVAPMMDEAELLAVKIQNLRKTRDLLLPRLLSGQINLRTPSTEVA